MERGQRREPHGQGGPATRLVHLKRRQPALGSAHPGVSPARNAVERREDSGGEWKDPRPRLRAARPGLGAEQARGCAREPLRSGWDGDRGAIPVGRQGTELDPRRTRRLAGRTECRKFSTFLVPDAPRQGISKRGARDPCLAFVAIGGVENGLGPGCWRIGRVGSPSGDDAVKGGHLGRK